MPNSSLSFSAKATPSQKHSVNGKYQAQVDGAGLRLSRKTEVIDVPFRTSASSRTGPSLLVKHQGADVELTVFKLGWYCERLARDLANFLNGRGPLPVAQ